MKRRTIATVLVIISMLSVASLIMDCNDVDATSSGTLGGVDWSYDDNTLTISPVQTPNDGCDSGYMKDYPYYGANTTWNNSTTYNIKTIIIKDGVKSIGDCVFSGMTTITTLRIENPELLEKIGVKAFTKCSNLNVFQKGIAESYNDSGKIYLGENLRSIDGTSFAGTGFESIYVNEKNSTYVVKYGLLYTKDYTELVYCPTMMESTVSDDWFVIDGQPIKRIADQAFRYCNKITGSCNIPDSIEYIGENAFQREDTNAIGKLKINSVTLKYIDNKCNIKGAAFSGVHVKSVIISEDVIEIPAQIFRQSSVETLTFQTPGSGNGNLTTIKEYAFESNSLTGDLVLPEGITKIEGYAFSSGTFDNVTLPSTLTIVGNSIFSNGSIKSINIPPNLTNIGGMFKNVKFEGIAEEGYEKTIVIPGSVTTMDSFFFAPTVRYCTYNCLMF